MNRKNIKVGSLITGDMLKGIGATCAQLREFERRWPNGIRIRKKNLFRAAGANLSIAWFAGRIFPGKRDLPHTEYARYWHRYLKVYVNHDGENNIQLDAARAFWDVIKERS